MIGLIQRFWQALERAFQRPKPKKIELAEDVFAEIKAVGRMEITHKELWGFKCRLTSDEERKFMDMMDSEPIRVCSQDCVATSLVVAQDVGPIALTNFCFFPSRLPAFEQGSLVPDRFSRAMIRPQELPPSYQGGEIWGFFTPDVSWAALAGRGGNAIVCEGVVVATELCILS
jgi:hypothetical protein